VAKTTSSRLCNSASKELPVIFVDRWFAAMFFNDDACFGSGAIAVLNVVGPLIVVDGVVRAKMFVLLVGPCGIHVG